MDPRRRRRTGAIRCADCARSDSLVTGLEPVDAMPLPAEAMAGFPDGVPRARGPRGLDRRLPAHGCAGHGVGLRGDQDRLDARVRGRGGRRAPSPCEPAGDDLPERRQRRAQHDRPDRPRLRGVPGGPAATRARPGPVGGRRRSARRSMPGTGGRSRGPTCRVSGHAATTATPTGLDTLFGDGSGGAGLRPGGLPGGRLHAREPLALRQPRLLVRRGAPEDARRAGSGAGSTSTARRQPAPGGLPRLVLSKQIRTAKAPVSAIRQPERRRVPGRRRRRPAWSTPRSRWRRWRRCRPAPATSRWPAARHVRPDRPGVAHAAAPARGAPASAGYPQLGPVAAAPAGGDAAGGEPRHAGRDARLGLVRHPRQPDREPGPAALDALPGARPRSSADLTAARHRGPRDDGGLLGVRAPRRLERAPGTDHGAGGLMMAMGSGGQRRPARATSPGCRASTSGDLRVTTDFRAVYNGGDRGVARGRPGRRDPGRGRSRWGARSPGEPGGPPRRGAVAGGPGTGRERRRRAAAAPHQAAARRRRFRRRWRWTRRSGQVVPSQRLVAAGTVTLRVYNRGQDDHDLTLVNASGTAAVDPARARRQRDPARDAHPRCLEALLLAVRGHARQPRGPGHGGGHPREAPAGPAPRAQPNSHPSAVTDLAT